MSAATLLARLSSAGISIKLQNGRLILEAPRGVITAELHAQMVEHKAELISTLAGQSAHYGEDDLAKIAKHTIAELLSVAYRRHLSAEKTRPDLAQDSANNPLAIDSAQSVHGDVP